ncbi:MAG: SGNH/GDSL hydrolase family protein [Clostridia bacterium]|nr:SGNH/GDSL hydrolase family protein [Clostridia bacterium]
MEMNMPLNNQYHNQYFSILGDSISTLDGYSEPNEAAFYVGVNKLDADVLFPEDTWWGQVIAQLGGELLVNNSISGSMVSKHPDCMIPSYSCSDERTSALGREGRSPDVIMIFMGINDWGHGVRVTPSDNAEGEDLAVFSVAYGNMLEKLKKQYPCAELWCFTLPVSTHSNNENFVFPYRFGGKHIEEYCEAIRACGQENRCRVIELYRPAKPYDTIDGFHPNANGMKTLAEATLEQL